MDDIYPDCIPADWSGFLSDGPINPDTFHTMVNGTAAPLPLDYENTTNIPCTTENGAADFHANDALCWWIHHGMPESLESLPLACAPIVRKVAGPKSEYVAPKKRDRYNERMALAMEAVLDEFHRWRTHYPDSLRWPDEDGDESISSFSDDIMAHMAKIASNAIRRVARRKRPKASSEEVERAPDKGLCPENQAHVQERKLDRIRAFIDANVTDPIDKMILRLKSERLTDQAIADLVGLNSHDAVNYRVNKYKDAWEKDFEVCRKPMGKASRKARPAD